MMKVWLVGLVLLLPVSAAAQVPVDVTGNSLLGWVQSSNVLTATPLSAVQGWVYRVYLDNAGAGTVLLNVTCTVQTPPVAGAFLCTTPWPQATPGTHTLTLTAETVDGSVVTGKSVAVSFRLGVFPAIPTNLRIIQPGTPVVTTSPEGTRVPPASQIVDANLATWTLGAGGEVLRGGVQLGGGFGSIIDWSSNVITVWGTDSRWYRWTGSMWVPV